MKFLHLLPFEAVLDNDKHEVALWDSELAPYPCELYNTETVCDSSGLLYGTPDPYDPTFCARHFYQEVVSGDGVGNYKLTK